MHQRRLEAELDQVLAQTSVHPAGLKWKSTIAKLRPNLTRLTNNEFRQLRASLRHLSKKACLGSVKNGRSRSSGSLSSPTRMIFETRYRLRSFQVLQDAVARVRAYYPEAMDNARS